MQGISLFFFFHLKKRCCGYVHKVPCFCNPYSNIQHMILRNKKCKLFLNYPYYLSFSEALTTSVQATPHTLKKKIISARGRCMDFHPHEFPQMNIGQ